MFHSSSLGLLLCHLTSHFGGFFVVISPPSVSACLSCLALYKEKLFFLVSVRQSLCLSVFVHVAVFPAVWLQVEKWGHPVGDLISWIPEG